jgi:hypothetical protein
MAPPAYQTIAEHGEDIEVVIPRTRQPGPAAKRVRSHNEIAAWR